MFLFKYIILFSIICSFSISLPIDCNVQKQVSIYDYIVVGSGPGGATIATRLAINNFKVLLIEAGPDYDDLFTQIPKVWPVAQLNPQITTFFNPYIYSKQENLTIQYPRGMTLGGSAQINAMITLTANPSDWDYIAQITNDTDWNSNNIRKKYQTLVENCQYCTNQTGWFDISITPYQDSTSNFYKTNPALYEFLETFKSNLSYNQNINENKISDCYFDLPTSVTSETGLRSGPYRRIKNIQKQRPLNLHVWTNTFVTKLIIDSTTKNTCGVEYVKGLNLYRANSLSSPLINSNNIAKLSIYAKREIIISGGQWLSPQLLQLSGIGDKDLLKQFGIDVLQHLPGVGQNQQDRNEIPYIIKLNNNANLPGILPPDCSLNVTLTDPCLLKYLTTPTNNLLASNNLFFSILRSANPKQINIPDSAFFFAPFYFTGFRENWVLPSLGSVVGTFLSININMAQGVSNVGRVQIKSTNAFDTPLIEMNHFKGTTGQTEINQLIEHLRYLRSLLMNSSFSKYIISEVLPGDNIQTDEQFIEYIRQYIWGHHACCTNKMGNTDTDPLAVVNSKAQVKGIQNLRICDISIFPKIPGYFPTIPIATACEKIADDIINAAKR